MRGLLARFRKAALPFLDDLFSSTTPGDQVRTAILARQIASTTQAMRSVALFVALVLIATPFASWRHSNHLLLLVGVTIVAAACLYSFRRLPLRERPERVARNLRRHAGTALALGVGWSLMTAAMTMAASEHEMLAVVSLQVVFICIGLMLYLNLPGVFLLFAGPVSVPLILELLSSGGSAAVLAGFVPVLIAVLARACVQQSRLFVDAGRTAEALRSAREREHAAERAADDERLRHAMTQADDAERTTRARRTEMLALAVRFERSVVALVDALSASTGDVDKVAMRLDAIVTNAVAWAEDIASRTIAAAETTGEVDAAARQLTGAISDIAERVEEHARSSGRAHRLIGSSGGWISAINEEMTRVTGVAGVIETMTAQTKLLALNAAIEAARAGDAGRGFVAVAQEVKALAHRAGDASRDVAGGIGDVSARMATVIAGIRDTATEIDRVAAIAQSITGSIAQQRTAAEQISGDIVRLSSHANLVRDEVADFVANSGAAYDLTRDVRQTVGSLAARADELRAQSDEFLERLRAA